MQEEKSENKKNHKCTVCGNSNTEVIDTSENSYGEFVVVCYCADCDIEFEVKR